MEMDFCTATAVPDSIGAALESPAVHQEPSRGAPPRDELLAEFFVDGPTATISWARNYFRFLRILFENSMWACCLPGRKGCDRDCSRRF